MHFMHLSERTHTHAHISASLPVWWHVPGAAAAAASKGRSICSSGSDGVTAVCPSWLCVCSGSGCAVVRCNRVPSYLFTRREAVRCCYPVAGPLLYQCTQHTDAQH
jgi:hypothetical protein